MLPSTFLTKSAINRARLLMRTGALSREAIDTLRENKMLPSVKKMTKGLDRGTLNLMREYDITPLGFPKGMFKGEDIPKKYRTLTPTLAQAHLPEKGAEPTGFNLKKLIAVVTGRKNLAKPASPSNTPLYGLQPVKGFINLRENKGVLGSPLNLKNPLDLWGAAATTRRHEVDEIREIYKNLRRRLPDFTGFRSGSEVLTSNLYRDRKKGVPLVAPNVNTNFRREKEKEIQRMLLKNKPGSLSFNLAMSRRLHPNFQGVSYSHESPEVILREAQNAAGMSPDVINFWRDYRTKEILGIKSLGYKDRLGVYGQKGKPSFYPLRGKQLKDYKKRLAKAQGDQD